MELKITPDAQAAAKQAAAFIAQTASQVLQNSDTFTLAVSGGSTPALMFDELAKLQLDWSKIHLFQVDERVAPAGSELRNTTQLQVHLLDKVHDIHFYPMPVETSDLAQAAKAYGADIQKITGGQFDLIHLGLGADGHTASLVPNDPVLDITDRDVWYTNKYQSARRLTMTYPLLNRAASIFFLATGADKAPMLKRLQAHNPAIPAGRVRAAQQTIFCDQAAASVLPSS